MTHRTLFIALMTAVVQLSPTSSGHALSFPGSMSVPDAHRPSGQWSMFMNGPQRRGITLIVGAQTSTLAWRISAETNYGGAVVGRNGTVYQATFDHGLAAIRPDGTVKWTFHTASLLESTPAILPDGRIAFVDDGGNLYVIRPDGTLSWGFQSGTSQCCNETAPAIAKDGTIYTSIDDTVYALHPDGTIRWVYPTGHVITGSVAVTPQGVVYAPAQDLIAIDADGSLLWDWVPSGLAVGGSPAMIADGTIYANSYGPELYAVNPDGTLKWSYDLGDCCIPDVPSSPAVGLDGTIYVGESIAGPSGLDGVMLALNPDGSLQWESHHGRTPTAPAIGGDGTIYFASGSGTPPSVFALNSVGSLKWQYDEPVGGYIRTPPAIAKDRVYAGSADAFFALGP